MSAAVPSAPTLGIPADLIRRMEPSPFRDSVEAIIARQADQGLTVVAYGEAGRGATLGAYWKVGNDFTFMGELAHKKGEWSGGAAIVWTPKF